MGRGRGKTPDIVVELLKEAVARKSQYAVAKETGLGLAVINRYLRGIGEPTAKTMEILADYFGKTVSELRGEGFIPKAFKREFSESTNMYERYFWLLIHEFYMVLEDDSDFSKNPIFIRPTYKRALDVLTLSDDFYNYFKSSTNVNMEIQEYTKTIFDMLKSDYGYSHGSNSDIKAYLHAYAHGVIKKYLNILEEREFDVIWGFSILYKNEFTPQETEIFDRRLAAQEGRKNK